MGGKPQDRVECRVRVEPPGEPEHVFVEIRLQVLFSNAAVMCAKNPRFEVGKDQVNHRQMTLGFLWVAGYF